MSSQHNSLTNQDFNKLNQFRQAAYGLLGNARDAQFELTDAVIQMRQIQSFAELSCAPAFRRKWSSAYEAIQDGRPNREGLLQLYLSQLAADQPVVLAGDHTAWQRLWAETLEGRSYQHQPTPIRGRRPVTIGHGYSTLVVVPEPQRSWALPLLHERISDQKPVEKGAQQLRQVCKQLKNRPLSIWDSEYGCAAFLLATADIPADQLLRLRTNLCLEGPTKPWKGRGQHPKHGIPFKFKDPTTWWQPDQQVEYNDTDFGPLKVKIWHGLRFKQALDRRMVVAQVERLQAQGTRRKPRILWFAWVGEIPPTHWWSQYNQRYPVDHWYRFAKGRLHWTLPLFATPQQAQGWSDLMPFLTWELWLARALVADNPLPWQKPQTFLSPGRVCQGMQNILVAIGTPTRVCKSRGIPPGWPIGKSRNHRKRYELVRSQQWKTIRERQWAKNEDQPGKRGRHKKIRAPDTFDI
jgi:hypothetical protein